MAAAMNGIAPHGGLIPYGGTFLCFSDYCHPDRGPDADPEDIRHDA
jgi:transketolase